MPSRAWGPTVKTDRFLAIGPLMMVSLVLAFAFNLQAHAQQRLKVRLILPSQATTYQLPYFIPKDTGWFDQRGLDVEEVFVGGDSTALRTVISGSGDITIVGPPAVFHAYSEGAKIKYVGSWQPLVDYQILSAKAITDLSQLADKTFASAGPSDLTAEIPRLVMRKRGINTDNVKFIQVGGHAPRLQALEVGKVQATMVNTLTSLVGQRHGDVNVLTKVSSEFPKLGYIMLTAKAGDLDDPTKRRALEIFLEGSIYGARQIKQNPERATEVLAKRVPDLPKDLIRSALQELNAINAWGVDGGLDPEMVTFTSDAFMKWNMIQKPVTPAEIVDDRLVKAALAKLGPQ
ncbi:MAG TPA: ABC transporter substrate-binding protein [Burkholderiales bacterium]|nr:ABC transporter substrate-binding protein [Burkholderiales bacterium]